MTDSRRSYERVNYLLRPSKQVERKIFVEVLSRLAKCGYLLSEYTYLGLGSIYYADFMLFHKYLYIDNMICAEQSRIPRRMRFNKPYDFIELRMGPVSKVIPRLDAGRRCLAWLDYDCTLKASILADIDACIQRLPQGSILIVTVDAEPRLPDEYDCDVDNMTPFQQLGEFVKYLQESFGEYVPGGIAKNADSADVLPKVLARILRSQIEASLLSQPGVSFIQLFNYKYADGASMLTVGGLLDCEVKKRELKRAGILSLPYVETGLVPKSITVPTLTPREKVWLDSNLGARGGKQVRAAFEITQRSVRNYRRLYRYYPTYFESLL